MNEVVKIASGAVRGQRLDDGATLRFLGVPYAAPPIGDLRWRPPRPVSAWTGVRDSSRPGAVSVQRVRGTDSVIPNEPELQNEDCLVLNVWTAAASAVERRPVIVWLHPGGFQFGSGSAPMYDGRAWARAGAVFVSLNFRLSKIGFLAHPALQQEDEHGRTGNYGLLDQVAALRWVRENIAEFGGDPNCVTIYGASSGASSVSLLMVTPCARGLFHRAIAESGGSFGPVGPHTGLGDRWQTLDGACAAGKSWAEELGAVDADGLRQLPVERIREGSVPAGNQVRDVFDAARPIVDGQVLPSGSRAQFQAGLQAPVPLLVGSAANEDIATVTYSRNLGGFLEQARHDHGSDIDAFLNLYPARTDVQAVVASLRANGHRLFTWQNWVWARLHAQAGHEVFYYRFEQEPPVPPGRYPEQRIARPLGAFHAASVFYTFDRFGLRPDWPWSDEDRRLGQTMTEAWVEFARTGRPTHENLPPWPRHDPGDQQVMRLSQASSFEPMPEPEHVSFWDEFYLRHGQHLVKG
jgi:para-nitrobenzyl esterase